LRVTTETGLQETAVIKDGQIVVSKWDVSGKLTEDRSSIRWSNGITWKALP